MSACCVRPAGCVGWSLIGWSVLLIINPEKEIKLFDLIGRNDWGVFSVKVQDIRDGMQHREHCVSVLWHLYFIMSCKDKQADWGHAKGQEFLNCPVYRRSAPPHLHSRWRDGPVALLAGCVPDLGLHRLAVHLDAARGELDSDGAFALQVELVSGETGQQVTLSHTRVANKDHWNAEWRLLMSPVWIMYVKKCWRVWTLTWTWMHWSHFTISLLLINLHHYVRHHLTLCLDACRLKLQQ